MFSIDFDRSIFQLVLFPAFVILAWRIRIFRSRIPVRVLILAAFGAVVGAIYSFSLSPFRGLSERIEGVVLARLAGDDLESSSLVLRDEINRRLKNRVKAKVGRYFRAIGTQAEADLILAEQPDLKAIVWGSERWLTVSLASGHSSKNVTELLKHVKPNFPELHLVTGLSSFGLSYKPREASVKFIAAIFEGLKFGQSKIMEVSSDTNAELALIEAASMSAPWMGLAHRSFAFWSLGNMYLLQALNSKRIERGLLRCALKSYARGAKFVRPMDNPELKSAIFNNWAVVRALQTGLKKGGKVTKKSRQLLVKAVKIGSGKTQSVSGNKVLVIAKANLERLDRRKPAKHQRRKGNKSHSAKD